MPPLPPGPWRGIGVPYGYFEIHHLIRKCRHLVVKAHSVLSAFLGSEDEIALSLLLGRQVDLVIGSHYFVIDIKGAT